MAGGEAAWWAGVEELVRGGRVVVDRPAGSRHPRYPETVYPLDYGYLEGTRGGDGSGVDVWIGTRGDRAVVAAACCVDLVKREVEVKLLLGCTDGEVEAVRGFHGDGGQAVMMVRRAG